MEATMEKPRTKTRKKRDKQKLNTEKTENNAPESENLSASSSQIVDTPVNPTLDESGTSANLAKISNETTSQAENEEFDKNVQEISEITSDLTIESKEIMTNDEKIVKVEKMAESAPPLEETEAAILSPNKKMETEHNKATTQYTSLEKYRKEITFQEINQQLEKDKHLMLKQLEEAEKARQRENQVRMRAFTESQLAALYTNGELKTIESFVTDFIAAELKGTALKQHPLYELLVTYLQARKNVKMTEHEISDLRQSCETLQKELWKVDNVVVRKQGTCDDDNTVYASYSHNVATFSHNNFKRVNRDKNKIQELISQSHAFYCYMVQVSKLQIESFIQNIIHSVVSISHISPNSDVTLMMQNIPAMVQPFIGDLRLCVSILFQFQRKFIADPEFVKEARSWLNMLVAVLLRFATWQDHLFLLNHILRCPPGVASWAVHFIQAPIDGKCEAPFADYEVNHVLAVLGNILLPITKREQFLEELSQQPDAAEALWVVIDSDGEEDEETAGTALKENDLVSMLNQLPLEKFFRKVLRFEDRDVEGVLTQNHILQLFSFCTTLLKILQNGLLTYNQVRYLQLCKRLSRFIRHVMQYATDQLELFFGSSEAKFSTMLERLQVEYDALFLRAFYYLYVSEKLGAWQFLAVLPFDLVTNLTLWKVFYFLHDFDNTTNTLLETSEIFDYQSKIWNPSFRGPFEEHLSNMAEDECYYLLSTIANMALNRPPDEYDFIKCATLDILHIGFVSESTQESCSKNARILLTHITSKYPKLLADVFETVQENMTQIGRLALYLYEELPISIWQINDEILSCLENWLLHKAANTNESKLSRMIISRLNWDLTSNGDPESELFLPYEVHSKMASLIVIAAEADPSYLNWAWQTAVRLKLHMTDKGVKSFSQVKDIEYYVIIDKGVREQQPLAAFLSVLISSWGHLIPLICTKGFEQLLFLQLHQKHEAVLFALNLIVPLFLNCQENVINLDRFQMVLMGLLNADRTYVNMAKSLLVSQNTILEQFGNMIIAQIANYKLYDLDTPRCVVRLWIDSLVSVTNWNRDHGVMYLLDVIIRSAFFYKDSMDVIYETLRDLLQAATPQESSNSLSSLFKWAATGSNQGNLLINSSLSNYPYLAVVMIDLEHEERERGTNLWNEILQQLYLQKGRVNVDAAIKKSASKLKLPAFASGSLCLFRWAQQALDTPVEHPIAVLFWQKFFCLYLHHVRIPPNQTVCVGEKFFEGVINFNFLKRMKKKLQDTVEYYTQQTTDCDFKHLEPKAQLHLMAVKNTFTAFSLWLEEPRLQEPSVYVPGLPPQYEPSLLNIVFQCNADLWLEYVDYNAIQDVQVNCIKTWNQANYREKKNINMPCSVFVNSEGKDPWKRIENRLKSYDTPKGPPELVLEDPLLPALDVNDTKTISRVVNDQLEKLTTSAHNFYIESTTHTAMNREYENLIIKLYISKSVAKTFSAYCTKNDSVQCSGPATILFNTVESKINDTVAHRLDEFSASFDAFILGRMQPAPVNLCYSSMFLQHIISLLENQKLYKREPSNQYGVELFYHILTLINEETSNYYPTKKLFSECLERLGQSHIHGEEEETPKLLDKILQDPNMGSYLAPHFSPVHVGTANFIMMYSMISKGLRGNSDLLYSLLSKFDVSKWLQRNSPKLSQRSQFIELVMKALVEMGPEPKLEQQPLHELYRKHLVSIFQYQFPEHYGEILMHILRGSTGAVSDCITVSVWLDILSTLAYPQQITLTPLMRDQLRHYAQNQNVLSYQMLMDTTRMLAQHYTSERLQYGLNGLYPKTSNYVEVISVFLGMTGHSFVISALNTHQGVLGEKVCEIIWPFLRDMFAPWIVPYWANNIKDMATWIQQLTDDRAVILPWIPANAPYAQKMVNSFFECILFIIQTLPACNNIMSFFWNWYVTNFAHPTIKDHVINVIHQAFIPLPWNKFWPCVQDVELMLKVAEQYLPESHTFLGHIFMEVQWHSWLFNLQNAAPPVKTRIHHCLLSLIIKLCNEPNIRRNCASKAINLLNQAEHFEWQLLDAQSVMQAMDWYIMSCDPTVILKTDHGNLDVRVLNFICIVCCYNQPYDGTDTNILIKRLMFVKTFVKLVSVFISKNKNVICNKEKDLVALFASQLSHLEHVVRTQQEVSALLGELLGVMNQNGIKDGVLKYFVQWLSDKEGNGMMVKAILHSAGYFISDISTVGLLYETALTTYFIKNVNDMKSVSWNVIAPELKPYVSKYSSLVSTLIENGQFLTLHALLLDKMATSEDKPTLLNFCLTSFNDIKVNENNEHKLPLLWHDFLQIVAEFVQKDESTSGEFLYKFSQHLHQLSEQKENAKWGGLLGAIGIGKQTTDNLNFRFICRALAGYILSQLPEAKGDPQKVRTTPAAPCAVGQPGGNTEVSKILLKMDFAQSQGKIKECAEKVLKQIQDPQNSFHNVNAYLRNLLLVFYTKPYLKEI